MRMRWTGYVTHGVKREMHRKFWLENLTGNDFEDPGIDERRKLNSRLYCDEYPEGRGIGSCIVH
jgi:hypothetical protein